MTPYVFISGATGGIGRAFSFLFAEKGFNLFLTGRSDKNLSVLKEELFSLNDKIEILSFPCDLTDHYARKKMLEYIDQKEICFCNIVNVAGVDTQKAFLDYTTEKLIFQLRVNVEATFVLTLELIKRKAKDLSVLTIASMSGVSPMPYFAVYSATKCALINLFTSLHYELKKDGVKVTTVMPGGVYTRPDIILDIKGQGVWGKLSAKTPEYVAKKSFRANEKNKIKYVPGFFNKLLYVLIKIAPKRIVLSFIARRWKKQTKDAF